MERRTSRTTLTRKKPVITITLPQELEQIVTDQATRQGTTPELWTLDKLRRSLLPDSDAATEPESACDGSTMLDFFEGYVGTLHSSEVVPGGAQMSQDTGRKFAEGMLQKRRGSPRKVGSEE